MVHTLKEIWDDANSPLEYGMVLIIYGLTAIAVTGIGRLLFELITNSSQFNNTYYWIFDYI